MIPPAISWVQSKSIHLTAKRMNSKPAVPMAPERAVPCWLIPPSVVALGQSENTWPHIKDKSPSKHQRAENSFLQKNVYMDTFDNLKGKSIILSSFDTASVRRRSSTEVGCGICLLQPIHFSGKQERLALLFFLSS